MNRSPREPEVVSDDVVIWEYASEAGDTYHPYSDPYGSLPHKRQIPNLYSKNQVEWASDNENGQWTPNSDVVRRPFKQYNVLSVLFFPLMVLFKHGS